jgi:hypothetical protein
MVENLKITVPFNGFVYTTKGNVKPSYKLTEEAKQLVEDFERKKIQKLEYIKKHDKLVDEDKWYHRKKDGTLHLLNPKSAGNRKRMAVNGQLLYSGAIFEQARNNYIGFIKEQVFGSVNWEELKQFVKNRINYGLEYKMEIFRYVRDSTSYLERSIPDITNMWILPKVFDDLLQEKGILPDDNWANRPSVNYNYRIVDKIEEEKIEITFYA